MKNISAGLVLTAFVLLPAIAAAQVCGDGKIEAAEQCDDGNTVSGDGCAAACTVEQQCYDVGNKFSFFLLSDTYGGDGAFESGPNTMMDAVNRTLHPGRVIPRFWISSGDMPFMAVGGLSSLDIANDSISNGTWGQKSPFVCSASNGKFPYFVAIGNHDVDGYGGMGGPAQYSYWKNTVGPKLDTTLVGIKNFRVGPTAPDGHDARTTYSFDYKNAHFVIVNQYHGDPNYTADPINPDGCIRPDLYAWIDQDLAQTDKPVKFVAGHEPAWSVRSGPDPYNPTPEDEMYPGQRPRPYSTLGPWDQRDFGEHYGDSLEDNACPAINGVQGRRAFWAMLARHAVVAHLVGHTHTYSARLVAGNGARNNNNTLTYGKTGQSFDTSQGVWEVDSAATHVSAGKVYVLVTVDNNTVTFQSYDAKGHMDPLTIDEPFKLIESWKVNAGPPVPDVTPPLISNVTAYPFMPPGALVAWKTDDFSDAAVDYGTTTSYGSTISTPSLVTDHYLILTGLQPFTTYHYRAKSADSSGNVGTSGDFTFVTPAPDLTAPSVSFALPFDGAIVQGAALLIASASDAGGLAGLQFKLDGAPLGAELTAAPFNASWDTTLAVNGLHTLTAVARDLSGNRTTAVITLTVNNVPAPPPGSTVYVDPQIIPASCTLYAPATRTCAGGTATAYKTLKAASAAALAGTTVLIRGGTYLETLIPKNSGTASAPITFKAFPGETPVIAATAMLSSQLSTVPAEEASAAQDGYGIYLYQKDYIVVQGLAVVQVEGWLRSRHSSHNVFIGNYFSTATLPGMSGAMKFIDSHYNKVMNNVVSSGNDDINFAKSDHNLLSGNIVRGGRHAIFGFRCSNFNVIRDNYFSNPIQKIGEIFDCEGDAEDVPILYDAAKHNLVQNNVFDTTADNSDNGGPYAGIQYAAQNGIIRRNVFYNVKGSAVSLTVYPSEALNNRSNRLYHNVFYANIGGGSEGGMSTNPAEFSDNILKNNIYYKNTAQNVGWIGALGGTAITDRFAQGFRTENNDILGQLPGEANAVYLAGSYRTLASMQAANPKFYSGNLELVPGFVNETGRDFHLAPTSPLVDRGAFLTAAASAGSGTSLPVSDAGWFSDGFGVPDEPGDVIQLAGQTGTARIVAVNFAANILTLDRPLAWTAGQGVALAFTGTAPDMGAFEVTNPPPPPLVKTPAAPRNLRIR